MSTATRPAVPVRKFSNNSLIAFYQSSIGFALDANTSNVRAILVGLQSNILASSSVLLAMEPRKSGRVKQ